MTGTRVLRRHDHLSFKGNLKETRFGWLRLTPAYSVHLVGEILDGLDERVHHVLDPFCGTGTTALVCAERGIHCDTTDINAFLLWLTATKTAAYGPADLDLFQRAAGTVAAAMAKHGPEYRAWVPALHQIEKWWDEPTLAALACAMHAIDTADLPSRTSARDLLKIAFCRVMIERANVSFGHQSMSFKKDDGQQKLALVGQQHNEVVQAWDRAVRSIHAAAKSPIQRQPTPIECDARNLSAKLRPGTYDCVITSPPYPNRMSYIRELRPYMYWLRFLESGRAAGELDWHAIGGTWGCATSNVGKWEPDEPIEIPYDGFEKILSAIAKHSGLLSRYVHKYFHDMVNHVRTLHEVMAPGGVLHYVIGNSKFYDVMLPAERIFRSLFVAQGFTDAKVSTIRKRTSKKELFEFVVSARKRN